MMRKLQIVLVLFAVLAFSVVATVSASAETTLLAEWLFNGAAVTALLPVEMAGEFLLALLILGVEALDILCSAIFDGSVGPNGEDEITKVLNLVKEEIGSELVGLPLECVVDLDMGNECGGVGTIADVWPDDLPWHTQLDLMESGVILDHFLEIGFHIFCLTTLFEELCLGLTSSTMTNGASSVTAAFDATSEHLSSSGGECHLVGEFLVTDTGGTLAVSSV
jgi:hypothetical protein